MMNRRLIAMQLVLLMASTTLTFAQVRVPRPVSIKGSTGRIMRVAANSQSDDIKKKNVFAQLLQMIASFFSILQDPNNAVHVTGQVTNMFSGMMNIVAEEIKSGRFPLDADDAQLGIYAYAVSKKLLPLLKS
jgi:hypothetical protein